MNERFLSGFKTRLAVFLALVGITFVFVGFLASLPASAQLDPLELPCRGAASDSDVCDNTGGNPIVGDEGILTKVTNILATITAVIAVIVIVVAGLTMTLSSGNSQSVQSSRDAIIYAAVALVIAALARAIVLFVVSKIGN